LTPDGAIGIFQ